MRRMRTPKPRVTSTARSRTPPAVPIHSLSNGKGEESPAGARLLRKPVREAVLDDPFQSVAPPLHAVRVKRRPPLRLKPLQCLHHIAVVADDRWALLHVIHPTRKLRVPC